MFELYLFLARGKAENNGEELPLNTGQSELDYAHSRIEYYAFLEKQGRGEDVAKQAGEALEAAHLDTSPKQVFDAIRAFSVELDDQEAEQLRKLPCIKCCEADQLLTLTDSIESEVAEDIVYPAIGIEAPEKRAFQGSVINGSQNKVEAKGIETNTSRRMETARLLAGKFFPMALKAFGVVKTSRQWET